MIDPLLSAAIPLPAKNTRTSPTSATPSFLQWAMSPSTQFPGGGHSLPGDAGAQRNDTTDVEARKALAVPAVAIDPTLCSAMDTLVGDHGFEPPPGPVPSLDSVQQIECAQAPLPALQSGPTLEFHLRNPQGEREIVAMPWRLIASGRLAQSLDGHAAGMPGSAPAAKTWASTTAAVALSALPAIGDIGPDGTLVDARHANGGLPSPLGMAVAHATADIETTAPSTSTPASPAAVEWLARWIRWIERDGHDPAIWLRDYRIDDDEARRVADQLRAFAREQGVSLERIVVNGRERWRNAHSAPFKE